MISSKMYIHPDQYDAIISLEIAKREAIELQKSLEERVQTLNSLIQFLRDENIEEAKNRLLKGR
jgi:hypothetical protein